MYVRVQGTDWEGVCCTSLEDYQVVLLKIIVLLRLFVLVEGNQQQQALGQGILLISCCWSRSIMIQIPSYFFTDTLLPLIRYYLLDIHLWSCTLEHNGRDDRWWSWIDTEFWLINEHNITITISRWLFLFLVHERIINTEWIGHFQRTFKTIHTYTHSNTHTYTRIHRPIRRPNQSRSQTHTPTQPPTLTLTHT